MTLALTFALSVITIPSLSHAHGPMGKGSAAFEAYEKGMIGEAFKGKANPLTASPEIARAGKVLYDEYCISCHGAKADGKGELAADLNPKPADLKMMLKMFPGIDDYYFWIISVGGGEFYFDMPPFEDQLSQSEIWQIVTWMQGGFEGAR